MLRPADCLGLWTKAWRETTVLWAPSKRTKGRTRVGLSRLSCPVKQPSVTKP